MGEKEANAKPQAGIMGKIARLSEPYFTSVQDCVEQAVLEEQRSVGSKQPENGSRDNGDSVK